MLRLLIALVASTALLEVASAQPGATYQRRRGHSANYPAQAGRQHYNYNHGLQRRAGPAVAAGAFQRPYPYHLDYYKHRWGGSYAPYFGNLYGPPNVVLGAAPYVGYGVPYAPPTASPQQPTASQSEVCPHCHQPINVFIAPAESPAGN